MSEENYDIYLEEKVNEVVKSVAEIQQRMDFFESIVLRLLVGLKDAGIIVDSDEGTVDVD